MRMQCCGTHGCGALCQAHRVDAHVARRLILDLATSQQFQVGLFDLDVEQRQRVQAELPVGAEGGAGGGAGMSSA